MRFSRSSGWSPKVPMVMSAGACRLGPFASEHGMASSPILVDGNVIVLADQLDGSFIAAYQASDGKLAWKTSRHDFVGGYATPAIYRPAEGPLQLLVPGPYELAGYAAATGERHRR